MPWFGAWLPPLPVSIASVSYNADVHEARVVVERLDDAVVSDATRKMIRRATPASRRSSSRRAERAKTTVYSATPPRAT